MQPSKRDLNPLPRLVLYLFFTIYAVMVAVSSYQINYVSEGPGRTIAYVHASLSIGIFLIFYLGFWKRDNIGVMIMNIIVGMCIAIGRTPHILHRRGNKDGFTLNDHLTTPIGYILLVFIIRRFLLEIVHIFKPEAGAEVINGLLILAGFTSLIISIF